MAAEEQAAQAAEGKLDVIGHLVDQHYLQVPFINAHNLLDGRLELPSFPPFHVLGITVDLSITRHVVMMWGAALLLVVLLLVAFRKPRLVPSGLSNLFESLTVFVRDEIVLPSMGERGKPYLPYLLTAFFFILTCNLSGLVPYVATPTGNISVTAGLALCTLALMFIAGIANNGPVGYVRSLVPHGIPLWLLPIMIVVELLSLFGRPFALCIRLFANMLAGHVIILSLIGMIFMFQTLAVAPVSVSFSAGIYLLEIFVALIQAYIFTLLSALFIGMAAHPEH
ncbi:MAG: F0F1 ATP synthase subunit A [Candidatus Latescibacterota bacterium]